MVQAMEAYALSAAVIILAVFTGLYLNRRKITNTWLTIKTRYRLNRLGYKQVSSIQWPDGLGHYFTIDKLILRHDGVSLLVYKPYSGKIFCADNIDDWTQMIGQKSYKFINPLHDLEHQIKIISACIPDVSVSGYLFFDHQAEFPKGQPGRVIRLNNIPEELKRNKKFSVEKKVMSAWGKLLKMKYK